MSDDQAVLVTSSDAIDLKDHSSNPILAKHFKIHAKEEDYQQFLRTTQAFLEAGLPFEIIAKAGEFLGSKVEKGEIDAALLETENELQAIGQLKEADQKAIAWQNRGETISDTRQLSDPNLSGKEIVLVSSQLSTTQPGNNIRSVLEVIAIVKEKRLAVESDLSENPYLKTGKI
jgi:hypothetical protein